MAKTYKWKRGKYPAEEDIRYLNLVNDVPPNDSLDEVISVTAEGDGDIVVDDSGFSGTVIYVVLSGGTKDTVFNVLWGTVNNRKINTRVIQPIAPITGQ